MPYGLLKNPIYSHLHHKNTMNVNDLNLKIINKSKNNSIFQFIHYPVPHSPFIYKNTIYDPDKYPLRQNVENYELQLLYVDRLFGKIIYEIKKTNQLKNSTIILLSDHGFRKILPTESWDHVPLIIYEDNNPGYKEVFKKVHTEKILFSHIKR